MKKKIKGNENIVQKTCLSQLSHSFDGTTRLGLANANEQELDLVPRISAKLSV